MFKSITTSISIGRRVDGEISSSIICVKKENVSFIFLIFCIMLFNHDDNNNNDSLSNTNCKQLYIYISTATR